MADKERILAVLPYGMSFRNIVLNTTLWGHLTRTYQVDVLTPLDIRDQKALGIDTVFPFPRGRLSRLLNQGLLYLRRRLDGADYYLTLDVGEELSIIYRYDAGPSRRRDILVLGGLRHTTVGRLLRRLTDQAPVAYGPARLLRRRRYKFVLIGHNDENECVLVGRAANALGVPVVCPAMGVDNVRGGPIFFVPDLLLVWGREQAFDFAHFQIPFNAAMTRTVVSEIGCLVYDQYAREKDDREAFLRRHDIGDGDRVVLFAPHVDTHLPGQPELCESVVRFIRSRRLPAKLLIRPRPNFDLPMWTAFQARHPDVVRLQVPEGASYDKSGHRDVVDLDRERADIQTFVATLRNSDLLLCPSFSTMSIDALALGTPSAVAAYTWSPHHRHIHTHLKEYMGNLALYPHWRRLKVVRSADELAAFMEGFFVAGDPQGADDVGFLVERVTAPFDGEAGVRAVEAITKFFGR
jgi:hypothetical protein